MRETRGQMERTPGFPYDLNSRRCALRRSPARPAGGAEEVREPPEHAGEVGHSSPVLGGMFTRHRLGRRSELGSELDCPHAMGTNAFSPQRPESFRHFLLLPSPSVVYHGRKPANLRVGLGARAVQFQASGLWLRSHGGWPTLGFDLSCPLPKNGCPTLS